MTRIIERSFSAKLLAAVLSFVIFFTQVLFAHLPATTIWETRLKASKCLGKNRSKPQMLVSQLMPAAALGFSSIQNGIRNGNLKSPDISPRLNGKPNFRESSSSLSTVVSLLSTHGVVQEIILNKNSTGPIFICIQDVHGQFEAQKNIASIILRILEWAPNTVVGLEGAAGKITTGLFRGPKAEINKELGAFFINTGVIGGPEYAAFVADEAPKFYGVESERLYLKNVEAVRKALDAKSSICSRVNELKKNAAQLKESVLTPIQKDLDRKMAEREDGRLCLGDYLSHLASLKGAPTLTRFPSLSLFLDTWGMERSIDFAAIEKERNQFVSRLVETLHKDDLEGLVRLSIASRTGAMTYAAYYRAIKNISEKNGLALKRFPAFDRYIWYVLQSDSIRARNLILEMRDYERAVWDSLCTNDRQREVVAISSHLSLLEKLEKLSLTPEEWAEFATSRKDIHRLPERIQSAQGGSGKVKGAEGSRFEFVRDLKAFEGFYELAEARNQALASNFLSRLAPKQKDETVRVAILVAGGFHSPGLNKILESKGTLITVAPKLSNPMKVAGDDYLSVFTREKTPLEKLFESPRISLRETLEMQPLGRPNHLVALTGELYQLLETAWSKTTALAQVGQRFEVASLKGHKPPPVPKGAVALLEGPSDRFDISVYRTPLTWPARIRSFVQSLISKDEQTPVKSRISQLVRRGSASLATLVVIPLVGLIAWAGLEDLSTPIQIIFGIVCACIALIIIALLGVSLYFLVSPSYRFREKTGLDIKSIESVLRSKFPLISEKIKTPAEFKKYKSALLKIARVCGLEAASALKYGIPLIADKIESLDDLQEYGGALSRIARASGYDTRSVLEYGLPSLAEKIQKKGDLLKYGALLSDIARASGSNVWSVFHSGLPPLKDLIDQYGMEPFEEIARASGSNALNVFQSGLPAVKGLIDQFGIEPFVEIARASGKFAEYVMQYGLPLLAGKIQNKDDLLKYGALLSEIARASGPNALSVFHSGLPAVKSLIDQFGIEPFVKITQTFGPDTSTLLVYGLAEVRSHIQSERDLLNAELWREGLGASRSKLQEPYTTKESQTSYWNYQYETVEFEVVHDPDQSKREAIDSVLLRIRKQIDQSKSEPQRNQRPERGGLTDFLTLSAVLAAGTLTWAGFTGWLAAFPWWVWGTALTLGLLVLIAALSWTNPRFRYQRNVSKYNYSEAGDFLKKELAPPYLKKLIRKFGVDFLADLVQASGSYGRYLFRFGLPLVARKMKKEEDVKKYGTSLLEIFGAISRIAGESLDIVFEYGVAKVIKRIHSERDLLNTALWQEGLEASRRGMEPYTAQETIYSNFGDQMAPWVEVGTEVTEHDPHKKTREAIDQAILKIRAEKDRAERLGSRWHRGAGSWEVYVVIAAIGLVIWGAFGGGSEYVVYGAIAVATLFILLILCRQVLRAAEREFLDDELIKLRGAWVTGEIKEIRDKIGFRGLAALMRFSGKGIGSMLTALSFVKGLLIFGIEPIIEIAKASGPNAGDVIQYGLPLVASRIKSVEDLRAYGLALAKIAETCGPVAKAVFSYGLGPMASKIKKADDLWNTALWEEGFALADQSIRASLAKLREPKTREETEYYYPFDGEYYNQPPIPLRTYTVTDDPDQGAREKLNLQLSDIENARAYLHQITEKQRPHQGFVRLENLVVISVVGAIVLAGFSGWLAAIPWWVWIFVPGAIIFVWLGIVSWLGFIRSEQDYWGAVAWIENLKREKAALTAPYSTEETVTEEYGPYGEVTYVEPYTRTMWNDPDRWAREDIDRLIRWYEEQVQLFQSQKTQQRQDPEGAELKEVGLVLATTLTLSAIFVEIGWVYLASGMTLPWWGWTIAALVGLSIIFNFLFTPFHRIRTAAGISLLSWESGYLRRAYDSITKNSRFGISTKQFVEIAKANGWFTWLVFHGMAKMMNRIHSLQDLMNPELWMESLNESYADLAPSSQRSEMIAETTGGREESKNETKVETFIEGFIRQATNKALDHVRSYHRRGSANEELIAALAAAIFLMVAGGFSGWLSAVPWWVWTIAAVGVLMGLCFWSSPYQRIRRAAGIAWLSEEAANLRQAYKYISENSLVVLSTEPFLKIAKTSGAHTWVVFMYGIAKVLDRIRSRRDLLDPNLWAEGLRESYLDLLAEGAETQRRGFWPFGVLVAEHKASQERIGQTLEHVQSLSHRDVPNELLSIKNLIDQFGLKPFAEIFKAAGENANLVIRYGLPLVASKIGSEDDLRRYGTVLSEIAAICDIKTFEREYGWFLAKKITSPDNLREYAAALSEIAPLGGQYTPFVWGYGLPLFSENIKSPDELREFGNGLLEIAKASGSNSKEVFERGLPAVKDLVDHFGLKPFIEMAKSSGQNVCLVFQYGLSMVVGKIANEEDLQKAGATLSSIALAIGPNATELFENGLPAVRNLVDRFGLEPLVDVARAAIGNVRPVFQYGLPLMASEINSGDDLRKYGATLSQIAHASSTNAGEVFEEGLPAVKTLVDRFGLEPFVEIAKTSSKNSSFVLYGLSLVARKITSKEDLHKHISELCAISEFISSQVRSILAMKLSSVENWLHQFGLRPFIAIAKIAGTSAKTVVEYGLAKVEHLIHAEQDLVNVDLLVKGLQASKAALQAPSEELVRREIIGQEPYTYYTGSYSYETIMQDVYRDVYERVDPDKDVRESIDEALRIIDGYFQRSTKKISEGQTSGTDSSSHHPRQALTLLEVVVPLAIMGAFLWGGVTGWLQAVPWWGWVGAICLLSILVIGLIAWKHAVTPGRSLSEQPANSGIIDYPTDRMPNPDRVLSKVVLEFVALLAKNQLSDVAIVGGAVRDSEPRDMDVTFALNLSETDKALVAHRESWNGVLGNRLAGRIEALAKALKVSVDELLKGEATFRDMPVHYCGPFEFRKQTGSKVSVGRSRVGIVISKEGEIFGLNPLVTISSMGVMPDKRWVGAFEQGREDIRARRLRTLKPIDIQELRPDHVLRYLVLEHRFGFSLSPEIQQALRAYAAQASKKADRFALETRWYPDFQKFLLSLAEFSSPQKLADELDELGLSSLLLKTAGPGTDALKKVFEAREKASEQNKKAGPRNPGNRGLHEGAALKDVTALVDQEPGRYFEKVQRLLQRLSETSSISQQDRDFTRQFLLETAPVQKGLLEDGFDFAKTSVLARKRLQNQIGIAEETFEQGRVPTKEMSNAAFLSGLAGYGPRETVGLILGLAKEVGANQSSSGVILRWLVGRVQNWNLRFRHMATPFYGRSRRTAAAGQVQPLVVNAFHLDALLDPATDDSDEKKILQDHMAKRIQGFTSKEAGDLLVVRLPAPLGDSSDAAINEKKAQEIRTALLEKLNCMAQEKGLRDAMNRYLERSAVVVLPFGRIAPRRILEEGLANLMSQGQVRNMEAIRTEVAKIISSYRLDLYTLRPDEVDLTENAIKVAIFVLLKKLKVLKYLEMQEEESEIARVYSSNA